MARSDREGLTREDRALLMFSKRVVEKALRDWPSVREYWLAEMVAGRGMAGLTPGEVSQEVFRKTDEIYEAAVRNIERLGK